MLCILLLTSTVEAKTIRGEISAQPWTPGDAVAYIEDEGNRLLITLEDEIAMRKCEIASDNSFVYGYKASAVCGGEEVYIYFRPFSELGNKNYVAPSTIPNGVHVLVDVSDQAPSRPVVTKTGKQERKVSDPNKSKY